MKWLFVSHVCRQNSKTNSRSDARWGGGGGRNTYIQIIIYCLLLYIKVLPISCRITITDRNDGSCKIPFQDKKKLAFHICSSQVKRKALRA